MKTLTEILEKASTTELASKIIQCYLDMKKSYLKNNHKYGGLDAGHFSEAIRRFIEFKLFGTYTSLDMSLSKLTEQELQRYINATGPENYRIIIPRVIFSVYTLRNKRGIGHLSKKDPSVIDSNYILNSCNWMLAEIIRHESDLPDSDCQKIIENIVTREIPVIWKTPEFTVITDTKLNTKDKILILLLDETCLSLEKIKTRTRYSNISRLRTYLRSLISKGYIHYQNNCYYLSPVGQREAEKILLSINTNIGK